MFCGVWGVMIVLSPAIALMNRLNFFAKFTLISVLFFLPMVVTSAFIVKSAYQNFLHTQHELAGLESLTQSLKVNQSLETYYDWVQINAFLGQSASGQTVEQNIRSLEDQALSRLEALSAPHTSSAVADFTNRRDELIQALQALQAESSLQSKNAMAEKLLSQAQNFTSFIASQSGLAADRDAGVRQLISLMTVTIPQVNKTLAQGRAIGSYSLGQGFLGSSDSLRMDELLLMVERNRAEYSLKINDLFAASAALKGPLEPVINQSLEGMTHAATFFEDQVIVSEHLDMPWQAFFNQATGFLDRNHQVNETGARVLHNELSARLQKSQAQMYGLVAALVAVVALIAYLYTAFYVSVRGGLKNLAQAISQVSSGDMTARFTITSRDEIGELGEAFNNSVINVRALIAQVGQTVVEVERQAGRVQTVSGESNQAVSHQMGQIDQVATAMNEMSATTQEVARSAISAVESAEHVNQETILGRKLLATQVSSIERLAHDIDESVEVINELAANSKAISQVLDVIKGIAEQTNLLALNAAIEAARAGEQGRGFAVVADEVRSLALRTQHSTAEIEEMIDRLQNGVNAAVTAMNSSHAKADETVAESGKVQLALENILGAITQIVDQNQQIAAAAEQQTAVAHDIDQNIVEINQFGERTAQGAGHTEQASRELSHVVGSLKEVISAFKI